MNEKFQTVEKICRVYQIHTHRKGSETGNTTLEEKSDEDLRAERKRWRFGIKIIQGLGDYKGKLVKLD